MKTGLSGVRLLPDAGFFRPFRPLGLLLVLPVLAAGEPPEADTLVEKAFAYYRDEASVAKARMIIHRPDWQREQVLHAWTVGEEKSLFTIVEPARDQGNGTLKIGDEMWTFNPKVNRIIKLPPSMMAQSWMGSDFSNNDLAKADSLIRHYSHRLIGEEQHEGKTVYIVESRPDPGAPVIWGKEILRIREDLVFLEEAFYDEEERLVKTLSFEDIGMVSGKPYPRRLVMRQADQPDHYTQVEYLKLAFRETLPEHYFSRSTLRNPPSLDLE